MDMSVPVFIRMTPTAIKMFRAGLVSCISLQREKYSWLLLADGLLVKELDISLTFYS